MIEYQKIFFYLIWRKNNNFQFHIISNSIISVFNLGGGSTNLEAQDAVELGSWTTVKITRNGRLGNFNNQW